MNTTDLNTGPATIGHRRPRPNARDDQPAACRLPRTNAARNTPPHGTPPAVAHTSPTETAVDPEKSARNAGSRPRSGATWMSATIGETGPSRSEFELFCQASPIRRAASSQTGDDRSPVVRQTTLQILQALGIHDVLVQPPYREPPGLIESQRRILPQFFEQSVPVDRTRRRPGPRAVRHCRWWRLRLRVHGRLALWRSGGLVSPGHRVFAALQPTAHVPHRRRRQPGCCPALKVPLSGAAVSTDGVGRETPPGVGAAGFSSVRCRVWSAWCRWCQSTTSVTAERAAASSTRFLPAANAATSDC